MREDDIILSHIPDNLKNSKLYDILIIDCQGKYSYVNETFQNKFSFITDNFIGKSSKLTMHPDDLHRVEEAVHNCFSSPNECHPIQLRKPVGLNNGYNWTQWEFSALRDENDCPIGVLCVGFDITSPMHNNFKLKEYETKLTKTIESIPHPLLIADASGTINFVNTEFENIFGYSLEEIENEKIEILYPEGCEHEFKKLFEFYIKNSAKKMRIDHYLNFESKSKENITVGVSLNSFYDNDNLNIIVILEDLTIAKQHQDTILNQNDVLKKIAWKHSHEIRKPVANILGLSDLFDEINLDNETNYKTISYLKEAARELDLITQSIVEEANNSEYDFRFKKHKRHLF